MQKVRLYLKLFLLLVVAAACATHQVAHDRQLEKAVKHLDQASELKEYLSLAYRFDQLQKENLGNWLPAYYHALALIKYALRTPNIEEVDNYCDMALMSLDAIDPEKANSAEVLCLKAMERSVRIRVDLMMRGMEYSLLSEQYLEKAIAQDPDNPRAYLLKGQNAFNRPEIFGGGKATAKPFFEKSVAFFQKEKKNLPAPSWGQESAINMLNACN